MASSSSTPSKKYEVFLSFRGEDTRNNLVSHLYAALHQRGIRTFFDEEDLEKGQSITPELLKSIEKSKFAIVVFSENYASSTWCLDELVTIMECRSKYGLTVIPVFYHIDPSDIRKQKNTFAESFAKHEVNLKDNLEKVQIWKDNLREAANISGHNFRNVPEAPLVNKIVEEIFGKLPLKASPEGLFGMECRLKDLCSLLAREPNDVRFIGIWGMGGIGKTTTARVIYNELIDGFEGGCFLQDVSKNCMKDLQKALLSEVLRSPVNIYNEFEGSDMIRKRLCSKKVLLVLDNIDNENQLESLAGNKEWFGNGSRIIVTTRNKHLLNDVNELYKIETLLEDEALQLFCWHAFRMSHPAENFERLSDSFLHYACGLPLALKILGSHMRGRQKDVWKCTLDKLKDDPDKNIFVTLKISFDGLSDIQQNIFLDIACFFRGHYKAEVNEKLDSCGFYPVVGIPGLMDKCLIHIESNGKIQMHDLIQEMGRDIVRQKANKKSEGYSRLWDVKDIIDVLTKGTGTDKVEALVLNKWCGHKIKLSEGVFNNMNMLRLLEFDGNDFVVEPNYLPDSLRCLNWWDYPGKSLLVNFKPNNLVRLNLSSSRTLETFPNLLCMPNLEFVDLSRCRKLLEVSRSVVVHKKLIVLVLSGCDKLNKFPSIQMESLESLYLDSCRGLRILPEFHSNMICLRTLELSFMNIYEFPWSVGRLTSLQEINMEECLLGNEVVDCFNTQPSYLKRKRAEDKDNEEFITSRMLTLLLTLPSLRKVNMVKCKASKIILPEIIGSLTSLQELNLDSNEIDSLPESINRFSSLQALHLSHSKITELPELPSSITELVLDCCTKLTLIPHPVALLDKYDNLHYLSLVGCEQLASELLLGPRDWISLANVLSRRQESLQLLLPHMDTSNRLYQEISSNGTVTVSPSWYSDKIQGFVIFAISDYPGYEVFVTDVLDPIIPFSPIPDTDFSYYDHNAILYIPIDKITRGKDWNGQQDCCLLEVANCDAIEWGIRLVYDGENAPNDISDLIIVNHDEETVNHNSYEDSLLKICVTARNQIH